MCRQRVFSTSAYPAVWPIAGSRRCSGVRTGTGRRKQQLQPRNRLCSPGSAGASVCASCSAGPPGRRQRSSALLRHMKPSRGPWPLRPSLRDGFGGASTGSSSATDNPYQLASALRGDRVQQPGLTGYVRRSRESLVDSTRSVSKERQDSAKPDDYLKSTRTAPISRIRDQGRLGNPGGDGARSQFRSARRSESARHVERLRHRNGPLHSDPARRTPGRRIQLAARVRTGRRSSGLEPMSFTRTALRSTSAECSAKMRTAFPAFATRSTTTINGSSASRS